MASSRNLTTNRFIHLEDLSVKFKSRYSARFISVKLEVDNEQYKSNKLEAWNDVKWECKLYLSSRAKAIITLRDEHRLPMIPKKTRVAVVIDFADVKDGKKFLVETANPNVSFCLSIGDSMPLKQVISLLGEGMSSALESKVIFLDKIGKVSIFLQGVIDIGVAISDSHPAAKAAFSVVSTVFKKCQQQQECHKLALDLLESVVAKLPFADIIPENMQSEEVSVALNAMLEHIRKIFIFLDRYSSSSSREDFVVSRIGEVVDLQKRLQDVADNFNTCVTSVQYRMVHAGREQQNIEALDKLRPVLTAQYNRDQACLKGTREGLLNIVMTWAKSLGLLETLFWLFGFAGSGKSAIASTICELLRQENVLAGSFNCKRDIPEQREAGNILPTLAYSLALAHKPYRDQVLQVLESEPAIASAEMSLQLRLLFMEPIIRLNKTRHFNKASPFVFVIDALDECGDLRTRTQVAGHLAQLAGACDWLKVIITSRPLPELHNKFDKSKCPHSKLLDLTSINVENDIYQYTKHSLEELASNQGLDEKWLKDDFIRLLSRKASGLFIWTSTVMRYVEGQYDQDAAFNMILSGPVGSRMGLDSLYLKIIRGSRGGSDAGNLGFMRAVLGMIYITAKNKPLTIDALHDFMEMSGDRNKLSKSTLRAVMNDLKSVLYEDTSKGNVIRVCHPSLLDFISDKDRSEEFWTDPDVLDNEMSIKCLTIMDEELKFNICRLESSHVRNDDVSDLARRIKEYISETLQYSCSYWIDHVGTIDDEERRLMNRVFNGLKVLYWIEVLSLISELQRCIPKLQYLLKINQDNNAMAVAVTDVYKFMTFFYDAMSVSTPHIYISALTWLPEESYLAKLLYPFFTNQPAIEFGREAKWQSSLWVKSMANWIDEVAFSPDGTKVAAASHDQTVSIWDVKSGERTGLIIGHPSSVMCLAWSPDGNRIISGSSDNVYVWDAKTYMAVGEAWKGHRDVVAAVAHSPDGKYIASSGWDQEVIVWYSDGRQMRDPLTGHWQPVRALAFSPDSKVLASGSDDMTIRLWSVETGEELRMIQHVNWVSCVTFSHDGRLLAVASHDFAITIWDAKTGEKYKEPFLGHYNVVRSVAFSPDDKLIASGSDDLTVCLWDVETGLQKGQPYRGHLHWILSVAFSPDGNYVASGANDFTVRLWDVNTNAPVDQAKKDRKGVACKGLDILHDGTRVISGTEDGAIHIWDAATFTKLKTLEGHTAQINSLKYSLDGKYILSASHDYTIRVWDADSGEQLNCLQPEGILWVNALTLSPDGKRFATSAGDARIRIWDIETREEVIEAFPCHDGRDIFALCYSKDGTLLASGGADKLVHVWKTENMERFVKPFEGHSGTVKTMVFSPNAEKLVSGGEDNSVRIWDVKKGEQLHLLDWHTYWVNCIYPSPDGNRFVTASADTVCGVWEFDTGGFVGEIIRGHSSWIRNVIYTPDGKTIITASDDSTLRLWDAEVTRTNYVSELDMSLASLDMDDGWICDKEGNLIVWVPPEQRNGLRDVCLRCIPEDALGHPVRLDWKKIMTDGNWTDILKSD